jgi:hypothetical protein
MAIDFNKFNEMFPADKMKKELKEAKENSGAQLPDGEYTCKLDKMELGESSKGALMIKAQFRITKGEHKKQCIFKNCVLTGTKNDGFMLHKANEFLESLDSGIDVSFEDWEQYNDLILDIAEAIQEDNLTYVVQLTKNGQYQDFEIVGISNI